MCATNACGCRTSGTGVSAVLWLAALVVWQLVKAAAAAALVAAVLTVRWLTGAPMWGREAIPVGWPRWQRAMARLLVTAIAAAGIHWPIPVAAALTALGSLVCATALESRRRARASTRPIRVVVKVRPPAGALTTEQTSDLVEDLLTEKETVR